MATESLPSGYTRLRIGPSDSRTIKSACTNCFLPVRSCRCICTNPPFFESSSTSFSSNFSSCKTSNNHCFSYSFPSFVSSFNNLSPSSSSIRHYTLFAWHTPPVWLVITLIILCISTVSIEADGKCPTTCECFWKNGKVNANCRNQTLISIPNGIDPATQVLNLDNNNFQALPTKIFQERGLINLQKIYLSNCKLGVIAKDAFIQLANLVELYLSSNLLTAIPTEPLSSTPNLKKLYLNKNPIRSIAANSFAYLDHLNLLDLSDCQIDHIEIGAFKGLMRLQTLKLDGNQLTTFSSMIVKDFNELYSLDLHRNPWKCDCKLRATVEWMISLRATSFVPPTCSSPAKLSGLMWNSLDTNDFACPPIILTREVEKSAKIGENVTFICTIKSSPQSKVSWSIDDRSDGNHSFTSVSLEKDKYNTSEVYSSKPETVASYLTVYNVGPADAYKSYICNAENQAALTSKNFTLTVSPSGYTVLGSWSRLEKVTTIMAVLITLVIIFVLFTVCLLRSRASRAPVQSEDDNKSSLPPIEVVKMVPNGSPSKVYDSTKESDNSGVIVSYGTNGITPDLTSTIIKNGSDYNPLCPTIGYSGLLQVSDSSLKIAPPATPPSDIGIQQPSGMVLGGQPVPFHHTSSTAITPSINNEPYTSSGHYNNYENHNVFSQTIPENLEYNDFNTTCLSGSGLPPATQQQPLQQPFNTSIDKLSAPVMNVNLVNMHHVNVIGQGSYNISHPTIVRYSPDEGYAEEQANIPYVLEGTEV